MVAELHPGLWTELVRADFAETEGRTVDSACFAGWYQLQTVAGTNTLVLAFNTTHDNQTACAVAPSPVTPARTCATPSSTPNHLH